MTTKNDDERAIPSLLDTDLYKLTMQAAVLKEYRDVDVTYLFHNRTPDYRFNQKSIEWLEKQIDYLSELRFTDPEIEFLRKEVPYLPAEYFDFLRICALNPKDEVKLSKEGPDDKGDYAINIEIAGKWITTILYEIPLLSLVSEAYFKYTDSDWNTDGQLELAKSKSMELLAGGCTFSEFGTRRRRSHVVQDIVMKGLILGSDEIKAKNLAKDGAKLLGTSNVHFARKYKVAPIGTVAHEWFMGVAALTGDYVNASLVGIQKWIDTVGPAHAGIALTDTFGTDTFLRHFKPPYLDYYDGVRQDSGDPMLFAHKMADYYFKQHKYPKYSKTLVFSDSLNADKCIEYNKVARGLGFKVSFGVGTFLTNDFHLASNPKIKSHPLNIVIKLDSAEGRKAIKISDNIGKNTGDPKEVERAKKQLGYIEREWEQGDESHRW